MRLDDARRWIREFFQLDEEAIPNAQCDMALAFGHSKLVQAEDWPFLEVQIGPVSGHWLSGIGVLRRVLSVYDAENELTLKNLPWRDAIAQFGDDVSNNPVNWSAQSPARPAGSSPARSGVALWPRLSATDNTENRFHVEGILAVERWPSMNAAANTEMVFQGPSDALPVADRLQALAPDAATQVVTLYAMKHIAQIRGLLADAQQLEADATVLLADIRHSSNPQDNSSIRWGEGVVTDPFTPPNFFLGT